MQPRLLLANWCCVLAVQPGLLYRIVRRLTVLAMRLWLRFGLQRHFLHPV